MSDSKGNSNVGTLIRQSSFVKRQVSRLQNNSTSSSEERVEFPSEEVDQTKQVCDENPKIFKKVPSKSNLNVKE